MQKYRERIYANYTVAWNEMAIPKSVSDFANRTPTMRYVIKSFFPEDKMSAILDLGCGHGTMIYFAQQEGYYNIRGVDVSAQQVALANKLGIEHVQQGELMETLRITPPSSLDAVVTFDVIEHFTKEELIDFVDAVHKVLKRGGRWIIHAPNGTSPFFGSVRYGDFTHEQAYTTSSLRQLFNASGFSRVEFAECAPRIHGIKSIIRFILWRCISLFYRFILMAETGELGQDTIFTRNFYVVAYK